MDNLREMVEERKKLLGDMQELHSRGSFDALAQEQWDRMDARYTELDAKIGDVQRSAKVEARAKALAERVYPSAPTAITRGASVNFADTREYRDAFIRSLNSGSMAEIRAWGGNDNGTSNAPVPIDMQRRIVELASKVTVLRSLCTVYNAGSDQQITVDTGAPAGYLVDETNTTTEAYAAPTNSATDVAIAFTRITVKDFAYVCRVPMTKWAMADYIAGGDYIARRIAEGVYTAEEDKLCNGTGAASATGAPAQPKGIIKYITDVTAQKVTATAGTSNDGFTTIAADNIIDTAHAVLPRYRNASQRWVMSDATAKAVRKLKDSANRYLWQVSDSVTEGLTNGINGSLYGIPVIVSEFFPTTTTAGTCAAIVGDFSKAEIYDRGPLSYEVDTATGLKTLTVNFQAWKRSDIVVTNPAAFGALVLK